MRLPSSLHWKTLHFSDDLELQSIRFYGLDLYFCFAVALACLSVWNEAIVLIGSVLLVS